MRRHLLGILAIVLIVVGLSLMPMEGMDYLANSSWRIGIVLATVWLALPQLQGVAVWFRRAAIVVAVVAAAFSQYGLILLPLIFFLWFFSKKKPASGKDDSAQSAKRNSQSA